MYSYVSELFNDRNFSLSRIRTFLRVAESGSIRKAAEARTGQQAQFSRELKQLSEWAGAELFKKSGRTKMLTPEGKGLQRLLLDPLKALCEFRQRIEKRPVTLQIGTGAALLDWWVIPRLNLDGKTRYRLSNQRSSTICEWLNDGRLDFGIIPQEYLQDAFAKEQLGTLDYALFVPAKLVPKGTAPTITSVLKHVPLAVLTETSTAGGRITEMLLKIEPSIRVAVTCESMPTAAAAVNHGRCGAVLPKRLVSHLNPKDFKQFEHRDFKQLDRDYFLVWTKRAAGIRIELKKSANELVKALRFSASA